jgi:hypothetical protein
MKENCGILSQSTEYKKYAGQHPGLNCCQSLCLWSVCSYIVEDVDQQQEQCHKQGHLTCQANQTLNAAVEVDGHAGNMASILDSVLSVLTISFVFGISFNFSNCQLMKTIAEKFESGLMKNLKLILIKICDILTRDDIWRDEERYP